MSFSKKKWMQIYNLLYEKYNTISCPLTHETPFQLLIAVILSAQCTDLRVNVVTKELFKVAPNPSDMAKFKAEEIEKIICTCGLAKAKSNYLVNCSRMICEDFGGVVPQSMEELIKLPGVGRKSANVVLGNAFDIPGFPVDTHVNRLLNLLGAVNISSPEKIESIVCSEISSKYWTNFSHLLIFHGRQVCIANRPRCSMCVLNQLCWSKKNGLVKEKVS